MLGVSFLSNTGINFNTFINGALISTGNESESLLFHDSIKSFTHPFYEAGFGIGHLLLPLKFEFSWKLNYRGENNFRFGINSVVL
jgi:hypothetical protein